MHFLWFFRRQNPTTLPPCDATCVLCPNLCTPCLGYHIGHAHMVPKFGVIACMPPHAPCTRSRFIFSVSPIETKLYAHPTMTMASMHGEYRSFPTLDAFSRVFHRQNPTTLPPHDATCVLCPNLCPPCLGDHIGHAHMVPKVGGHLMHASTCTMYKQDHSGLPEGRSKSGIP